MNDNNKFIKIHPKDKVAIALTEISRNEAVTADENTVAALENIGAGHKIALQDIAEGENVIKYGFPIGHATKTIKAGESVHTHNIKTNLSGFVEYSYNHEFTLTEVINTSAEFMGYVRANGEVGIRNELWVVPTVGCVNGIADMIIERFRQTADTGKIDAVVAFKHNYGCSQLGEDHVNTRTILGDIAKHPNAGGVLVLGLGCENNSMADFKASLGEYDNKRVRFLVAQEVEDEVETGAEILLELYKQMLLDNRQKAPVSKLKIGLKCGGSDGLSGITANPLLGVFSDYLIRQGGTTILTEVPEMFGAETILMNRCINREVFDKTVNLINGYKKYFMSYNQPVYENPSPGNKAGGITTLEEKSLGCTQKGGSAPVVDVLKYGEMVTKQGLNLLEAPGNDLVASTALAASGCQMVLFTTGRGTPFGSLVPTMKVSTNSRLYKLKPHWIDFNAGVLVEGESIDSVLEKFILYVIKVASGELVNSEKNNFREIAIFKNGVTL